MATLEQLVLDGLALNDVTNYRLQGFEAPPPKKRYEWAPGGDADGAALVRDPLFENREIQIRVRITQRATMDLALAAVAAISDKLEEADKHPEGLDLVWTPANGTKSITFKVLSGEITGIPVSMDGDDAGWFKNSPVVLVTLTCKPFGYGAEVVGSPATASTPVVAVTVGSVTGDVPAEARLLVTDNATQARRYMEWGLEQRDYDAATSNIVESDSMSVTSTGGVQTTRTGAYDPGASGNNVIRATLQRQPGTVAATGNLSHVGTFRVKARVWGAGTGLMYARLSWQEGDGPYRANDYVPVHILGVFAEIDLGLISIPRADLGTQRWQGRIEAYSEVAGDTLDVDYLVLMPAGEGYGKARGVGLITASSFNGYDEFVGLGTSVALNARVAPSGGTWATSGAATDFSGSAFFGGVQVQRTTFSEAAKRFAILGSTNYTDTQAQVLVFVNSAAYGVGWSSATIARWTDSSNYLYARWLSVSAPYTAGAFQIVQVVAGVETVLATQGGYFSPSVYWGIRLTAYASGFVQAELRFGSDFRSVPLITLRAVSAALATGGTLATGKPGFFDQNANATAVNRVYDSFTVSTPSPEPIVINSTRTLEVRHDNTLRADSSNTYYGPPPMYRGSRFLLPPAGGAARTSRIVVKAHRQDIESTDSSFIADSLTAQVNYTPRYLAVPR